MFAHRSLPGALDVQMPKGWVMVGRRWLALGFSIAASGLAACRSVDALPTREAPPRDLLVGVATHYDWLVSISCLTSSQCEQLLTMRTSGDSPKFVKLLYAYHVPEDDLSNTMLAHRSQWTIRAVRDPGCDEAIEPRIDHLNAINGGVPDLVMPSGKLTCYRFGPADYRATETVP